MSKYKIADRIVDTSKAKAEYKEETRWDGNNNISVNTGSQWEHETLYLSAAGNWYIVSTSQWQDSTPTADWVEPVAAAEWLTLNEHVLPDCLAEYADSVSE